jgi:hypothetical protein
MASSQKAPVLIGAGALGLLGVALIALPNLLDVDPSDQYGSETSSIRALKTIGSAQALFREADKDGDGTFDYATLAQLGETDLIDQVLASGTKRGYLYEAGYGLSTSEFIWYAVANPVEVGVTGDRSFATNHEGVIVYAEDGRRLELNLGDCSFPPGLVELGTGRRTGPDPAGEAGGDDQVEGEGPEASTTGSATEQTPGGPSDEEVRVRLNLPPDLLAHVKVGQRYRFELSSPAGLIVEQEWTVTAVEAAGVVYEETTLKDGAATGDPVQRRWDAGEDAAPASAREETLEAGGRAWTCRVVDAGGSSTTWTPLVAGRPTFPPRLKQQRGDEVVFRLLAVERP